MNLTEFNFQNITWLWALVFIPISIIIWTLKKTKINNNIKIEAFADKHLLPYLVKNSGSGKNSSKKNLIIWSVLWALGVFAMAGPRWDFKEIESFKTQKNLVILISLSSSMDESDLKPSRLIRARQKIDDILNENPEVNIGLIAFAKDAHLVTPISEDKKAIRYLLGALRTDLIPMQGNRLEPALSMADQLLNGVPGKDKAVLIMSDGNFEDSNLSQSIYQLVKHGIKVSTMGFGALQGNAKSQLDQNTLQKISQQGEGRYFLSDDIINNQNLYSISLANNDLQSSNLKTKDWEPRFYIFVIPLLLMMLPLFRKRTSINISRFSKLIIIVLSISIFGLPRESMASETGLSKFFKNQDMLGEEALNAKDYIGAEKIFKDQYRRGIAEYRAGKFAKAEVSFRDSKRPEVAIDSKYNLGNALAEQKKYAEAIVAYEEVLKKSPDHTRAKANLKIVQDLLKKQSQDQKKEKDNKSKDQKDNKTQDKKDGSGQDKKESKAQDNKENKGQDQNGQDKKGQENSDSKGQDNKDNKGNKSQSNKDQDKKDNKGQEKNKIKDQRKEDGKGQVKKDNMSLDEKNENVQNKENKQNLGAKENKSQDNKSPLGVGDIHDEQVRAKKIQQDVDADQWLNRITNDPHSFLKNQFLIESMRAQKERGN
jgi:Ca-activated chloride channel family protein